ncbi:MAG: hypothetical protein HYZ79_04810 [Candidatus Melainabacteria bacterium]|nr:hypothetical protein [Candidatus Melainabacteria bacterium]
MGTDISESFIKLYYGDQVARPTGNGTKDVVSLPKRDPIKDRYLRSDDRKPADQLTIDRLEIIELAKNKKLKAKLIEGKDISPEKRVRLLKVLADIYPGIIINNFESIKDVESAEEILAYAAEKEPQGAVQGYRAYKSASNSSDILKRGVFASPGDALAFPEKYSVSPQSEELFKIATQIVAGDGYCSPNMDPNLIFTWKKNWEEKSWAPEIWNAAIRNAAIYHPYTARNQFKLYQPHVSNAEKYLAQANKLIDLYEGLFNKDLGEKIDYLKINMKEINPHFLEALDEFNKLHGTSLELVGIEGGTSGRGPYRFSLINTFSGENKEPISIGLTFDKVHGSKEDVLSTLNLFYKFVEKGGNADQYTVWGKEHNYDLPKDKTAVMYVGSFGENRYGRRMYYEKQSAEMLELYRETYGADISCVCMNDISEWEKLPQIKKDTDKGNIPKVVHSKKENILSALKTSLAKAIDGRKEAFVLHYQMHGSPFGDIAADDDLISPQEIAQILATDYNGKPIAEQIDINIIANSCFSGMQLEQLIFHLEKQNTPVKNLRFISSAPIDQVAPWMAIGDLMQTEKIGKSDKTPFDHYFLAYYELIKYKKSQGADIKPPFGTFAHAIRFTDLMTVKDTNSIMYSPRAFHYRNMPGKNIPIIGEYFSHYEAVQTKINDLKELASS